MGGHVDGTANAGFEHLGAKVVDVLGEAEVSDFVGALVDEDVGRFEVPVDDFLADEFCEAGEDLAHNIEDLVLLEFFAFHELLEITVFAELGDDVETIFRA